MANKNNRQATATAKAPETVESGDKQKMKKGTSVIAQIKRHFMEVLGEYASSGQVNQGTLDAALEVFKIVPQTKGLGLSPELEIANIDATLAQMYESKEVQTTAGMDKQRKLLNRRHFLTTKQAKDATPVAD